MIDLGSTHSRCRGPAATPAGERLTYIPWAILAKKTFKEDIDRCPKCVGKMKLKSLVQKPENIARFLRHLGVPTEPPPLAPARAPPYWKVRELRRNPQAQTEMFDA